MKKIKKQELGAFFQRIDKSVLERFARSLNDRGHNRRMVIELLIKRYIDESVTLEIQ